jgi:hypothetical protein
MFLRWWKLTGYWMAKVNLSCSVEGWVIEWVKWESGRFRRDRKSKSPPSRKMREKGGAPALLFCGRFFRYCILEVIQ